MRASVQLSHVRSASSMSDRKRRSYEPFTAPVYLGISGRWNPISNGLESVHPSPKHHAPLVRLSASIPGHDGHGSTQSSVPLSGTIGSRQYDHHSPRKEPNDREYRPMWCFFFWQLVFTCACIIIAPAV
jgi:hypothetical protein